VITAFMSTTAGEAWVRPYSGNRTSTALDQVGVALLSPRLLHHVAGAPDLMSCFGDRLALPNPDRDRHASPCVGALDERVWSPSTIIGASRYPNRPLWVQQCSAKDRVAFRNTALVRVTAAPWCPHEVDSHSCSRLCAAALRPQFVRRPRTYLPYLPENGVTGSRRCRVCARMTRSGS
jgi:hypothetical protein